jgi:hypothetical protein
VTVDYRNVSIKWQSLCVFWVVSLDALSNLEPIPWGVRWTILSSSVHL